MNSNNWSSKMLLGACLVVAAPVAVAAGPCTGVGELDDEVECAIQRGLIYLDGVQLPSGAIDDVDDIAATALYCVKLFDRARELGVDPFSEAFDYAEKLAAAIGYVAGQIVVGDAEELRTNPSNSSYRTYTTGIAAMCFSASNAPERTVSTGAGDKTYSEIVNGLVTWLNNNQQKEGCGQGGWYYSEKEGDLSWGDNSISGYATLGLGFAAAAPPEGFGVAIPATTLNPLNAFATSVQRSGGLYDGGSGYQGLGCGSYGQAWINTLKTGNLLYELGLLGESQGDARVDRAVDFIVRYWAANAGQNDGNGWRGDYQAMFTMMKGLEGLGIDSLPAGVLGPDDDIDWFADVARYIVDNQRAGGYWTAEIGGRGGNPLNTAWALLTLEKAVARIEFGIPGQCVAAGQAFAPFDADDYVVFGTPPFTWTWTGNVNLGVSNDADNVFSITYGAGWTGSETITFTATDDEETTSDDDATFTVDPAPVVSGIPDQTAPFAPFDLDDYLSGIDPSKVTWSFAGNTCLQVSIDADNVVTVTNPGECTDPETITFTATATACDAEVSASDAATFTPNQPPVCTEAYANPALLWPANHKFVPISILGVTDPDGDAVTFTIDSIYQDEPVDTYGDGSFTPDGMGVGETMAYVRAERAGTKKVPGDGRVYHIGFTAEDGNGGSCTGEVLVGVPHDQGGRAAPVDGGALYDSTGL
jgi:hypothetical protein